MPSSSNKIISAVKFLYYGGKLIVLTAVDLIAAFISLLYTLFFSTLGYFLLSTLILGGIGFALIQHQVTIMTAVSHGWCLFQPYLLPVLNAMKELVPSAELAICVWNVVWGFFREIVSVALKIAINCSDSQSWLNFLFQIGHFGLAVLGAVAGYAENPLKNTITIWSADVNTSTPWSEFTKLFHFAEVQFECQCTGLSPIFNFAISIIDDENLGQAIDTAANAGIAAGQTIINNLILAFKLPDFSVTFDYVILTLYHVGDWLDDVIDKFVQLFVGPSQTVPDLFFGCVASRFVATIVQGVAIFVNAITTWGNTPSNDRTITLLIQSVNVADYVGRVNDTGVCVQNFVGALDMCLGEAAGAVIFTYGTIVQFLANIIQLGIFEFAPVSTQFFMIWGDSTYDNPLSFHVMPCMVPPCAHALPQPQSGLVCFVANLLGNSQCAKAFADLVSAVGELFGTVFLIADYILNLDYTTINFVGNPLDNNNRGTFTDIVTSIVEIPTNRLINVLDYTGHFIECIPGLEDFGSSITTIAAMIDFQLDNIFDVLITTLELIAQIAIWFLSVIGASPFGNSEGQELTTLFNVFVAWFTQILDLVVDFLEGFVDYALFPYFPTFFGQNSLLASTKPGTAKFTSCFVNISDCLCGLTKASIGQICFGELGCLAHCWPSCGPTFTTGRKRDGLFTNINGTHYRNGQDPIWYFYAVNFNDTICGPVFNYWYNNPPDDDMSVGESDGMELINCVNMIIASGEAASKFPDVPNTFFMKPPAMRETGHGLAGGVDIVMSVAFSNTLLMFADPSELRGLPDANTTYFDYGQELRRYGINDTIAINTLVGTVNALSNLTKALKNYTLGGANDAFRNSSVSTVAHHSTLLAARTINWVKSVSGLIVNTIYEGRRVKIGTQLYNAGVSMMNNYWYQVTTTDPTTRRRSMPASRKRYITPHMRPVGWPADPPPPPSPINDPAYYQNMSQLLEQNIWPVAIPQTAILKQSMGLIKRAFGQYMAHLSGVGALTPLKNATGQSATLETDIPNSCTTILTKCQTVVNGNCSGPHHTSSGVTTSWIPNPNISGFGCQVEHVTCTGTPIFVDHFSVCNEFFGAVIVAGPCSETQNETVIDFYDNLQQCNDGVNGVPGTPAPFRIFALAGFYTCFNTLQTLYNSPYNNSQLSELGTICLPSNGCTNCPTTEFIPGFQCQLLDTVVSDEEYLVRRCFSKFTKGPKIPQEPHNITAWEVHIQNISKGIHTTRMKCGNGRLEGVATNMTYDLTYRNPQTKIITVYPLGEQCDPPLSETIQLIAGINTSVWCGPACQWGTCGNGVKDPGECCDSGTQDNTATCTANCKCIVCGNGNIDPGETCDDGNMLDYDGCSSKCKIEICPVLRTGANIPASQPYHICPPNTPDNSSINTKAKGPHYCFPIGSAFSVLILCVPRIPLLWTYNNNNCAGNTPHPIQITDPCVNFSAVCVSNLYISDATQCASPVQLGTDFTCAQNCSFCGNAIVDPGEQCDDGSIFPTGIPAQDVCIQCKFACDCSPDPRVRCAGVCAGGGNNGAYCNPRDPFGLHTTQCADGFCLTTECAGDGILQGQEFCDSNTTNPLDGSATPVYVTGSTLGAGPCVNAWPSGCQCQPGRPCMGECVSYDLLVGNLLELAFGDVDQTFRSTSRSYFWAGTTVSFGDIRASIPCDVNQGAFACPVEGQFCVPKFCCGDGVQKEFGDASGKGFCEPGDGTLVNCPNDCNMVDNTTGYLHFTGAASRFSTTANGPHEITNTDVPYVELITGRRDLCTGIWPSDYIDMCKPPLVTTFDPASWIVPCSPFTNCPVNLQKCVPSHFPIPRKSPPFGAQIGLCFDQYGIAIRPALYCDRTHHTSCDHLNLTGSVCVSEACCGTGMVDMVGLDNPVYTNGSYDPQGNDFFSFLTNGTYNGDPTCGYENSVPSIKPCTCQVGKTCVGQCTFSSLANGKLCDPVVPTNSPWCPVGTDILYSCVPIRCCGDGIKETARWIAQ